MNEVALLGVLHARMGDIQIVAGPQQFVFVGVLMVLYILTVSVIFVRTRRRGGDE